MAALKQELADESSKNYVLSHVFRQQGKTLNRSLFKSRMLADELQKVGTSHSKLSRQLKKQKAAYDRDVSSLKADVATRQEEAQARTYRPTNATCALSASVCFNCDPLQAPLVRSVRVVSDFHLMGDRFE